MIGIQDEYPLPQTGAGPEHSARTIYGLAFLEHNTVFLFLSASIP